MKWVIVFLILLNVGILACFKISQASQGILHARPPSLQPEKIKLLTPQQVEALPKKSSTDTSANAIQPMAISQPVTGACYEWGNFSARNLPRARAILAKFSLDTQSAINVIAQQQTPQASTRYWVYIPRRPSLQAANAKMDELRRLGIDDIFVVQEPQWRYAISLGVFKDEQLASKRLEDVKSRGVVSAVKAVRNQEQDQSSLIINNMAADTAAEIEKLKPDFPGSEIKQVTCQ